MDRNRSYAIALFARCSVAHGIAQCYYLNQVACGLNLEKGVIRVFGDGDSAEERPDGTIRVGFRKTYLSDENGEPIGAAWYDGWFTPEGKGVPMPKSELEAQWAAEQEKQGAAK